MTDLATGLRVPQPNGRVWCPWCGWRNALLVALAISMAQPTAMITLTQVGASFADISGIMKSFRRYVVADGHELDSVWVVEAHRSGRPHVHAFVHTAAGVETLERAATRAGVGRLHVARSALGPRATASDYGFKGILGSPRGSLQAVRGLEEHRLLNNDRLYHGAGLFRDPAGQRIRKADAVACVRRSSGLWYPEAM
jgi:hypothetical protein